MAQVRNATIAPILRILPIRLKQFSATHISLHSSALVARGNVELEFTPGESASGWEAGFFQFEFLETNYATFRGRQVSHGSARLEAGHRVLCRDTLNTAHDLWYHLAQVQTVVSLPPSRTVTLVPLHGDEPRQIIPKFLTHRGNTLFLHHAEITFHFCTLLVLKSPANHFQALKHFYWNFRVDAHFSPNPAREPVLGRVDHSAVNIQNPVHSGLPNDSRFAGHFTDRHLPTANAIARRPITPRFASDWSLS